jgi:hypothetical protein
MKRVMTNADGNTPARDQVRAAAHVMAANPATAPIQHIHGQLPPSEVQPDPVLWQVIEAAKARLAAAKAAELEPAPSPEQPYPARGEDYAGLHVVDAELVDWPDEDL